jgi:hypothetical protein
MKGAPRYSKSPSRTIPNKSGHERPDVVAGTKLFSRSVTFALPLRERSRRFVVPQALDTIMRREKRFR